VHITDQVNPQRVHCYGPGIDPKGVRKGQPALFTVDATQAGIAPLEVMTTDHRGKRSLCMGIQGGTERKWNRHALHYTHVCSSLSSPPCIVKEAALVHG